MEGLEAQRRALSSVAVSSRRHLEVNRCVCLCSLCCSLPLLHYIHPALNPSPFPRPSPRVPAAASLFLHHNTRSILAMSLVPYDYDAAQPTHYDMLDLTPSATVDDVRVAYVRAVSTAPLLCRRRRRRLADSEGTIQARQIHPSKAPPELQEEASARFRLVAEAFAVLSNGEVILRVVARICS